ncbi:MAG: flagellar biosynthetic protein FliO [Steroidobacteraceae bacterium]|jgi:flagellar protein FliO/FliZ|nr:flagellar biosynthetic protein FliO [Steroidobacteraceae bacterium]
MASLAASAARAAEAPSAAPFAAPGATGSASAPGFGSLTQVALSLALVLALVFVLAWVMRRLRATRRPGAPGIDVLAEVSLGPKERAVLVQVERVRLLVGVAAGQVCTLHVLPEAEPVAAQPADAAVGPDFASLLRRSLGR